MAEKRRRYGQRGDRPSRGPLFSDQALVIAGDRVRFKEEPMDPGTGVAAHS